MLTIPALSANTNIVAKHALANIVAADIFPDLCDLGNIFMAEYLTLDTANTLDVGLKIRSADRYHTASQKHVVIADFGHGSFLDPHITYAVENGSFHFAHNLPSHLI